MQAPFIKFIDIQTGNKAGAIFKAYNQKGCGEKAASNMNFDHSIVKILKITCLYMEAVLS